MNFNKKNKIKLTTIKLLASLKEVHQANAHISEKQLDKDIEEALKHVRNHSNQKIRILS